MAFKIQVPLFERFADAVRQNGAIPVVVFLPNRGSLEAVLAGGWSLHAPLADTLEARGIGFLDALEAFRDVDGARPGTLLELGGHYSPRRNARVADWLAEKLVGLGR